MSFFTFSRKFVLSNVPISSTNFREQGEEIVIRIIRIVRKYKIGLGSHT